MYFGMAVLKPKGSYGPDGFPSVMLKKLAIPLCEPLAVLFQSSFTSNVLPSCWLHALVTPVFKNGVTSNPCNYRPISLTCVVCVAVL